MGFSRADDFVLKYLKRQNKNLFLIFPCVLGAVLFFALGAYFLVNQKDLRQIEASAEFDPATAESIAGLSDSFFATRLQSYDEVRSGENLSSSLKRMGVDRANAEQLIKALSGEFNMRSIKPGNVIMVEKTAENIQLRALSSAQAMPGTLTPTAVEIFSQDENGLAYSVRAAFSGSDDRKIQIKVNKTNVYKEHAIINGIVNNSLYAAIVSNGGDAQLVNAFSGIFAWQFDFFRESKEGDTYQMIVERNVADGRFIGFSRVLAAEYTNGNKSLRGYYFESSDKQVAGFFDDAGRSLKNAFLKAPLKLANISSGFNKRRFHPVQLRYKAHNGVDYGANIGTPVMAVANGVVTNAGFSPFNGNWVRLRHMNGYETEYLHANKLAKGIRVGASVKQGQIICYVGKTGLATGPHLHFGMKKHGEYVDPTKQNFARSAGIPAHYMKEFTSNIAAMVIALNRQAPKNNAVAMLSESPDEG